MATKPRVDILDVVFHPDTNPRTGGGNIVVRMQIQEYWDSRRNENLGDAMSRLLQAAWTLQTGDPDE